MGGPQITNPQICGLKNDVDQWSFRKCDNFRICDLLTQYFCGFCNCWTNRKEVPQITNPNTAGIKISYISGPSANVTIFGFAICEPNLLAIFCACWIKFVWGLKTSADQQIHHLSLYKFRQNISNISTVLNWDFVTSLSGNLKIHLNSNFLEGGRDRPPLSQ